jgi:hypothetical protein
MFDQRRKLLGTNLSVVLPLLLKRFLMAFSDLKKLPNISLEDSQIERFFPYASPYIYGLKDICSIEDATLLNQENNLSGVGKPRAQNNQSTETMQAPLGKSKSSF